MNYSFRSFFDSVFSSRINISATDGGGLRATQDAEVFISVIDSAQSPPIFEHPRYTYGVREDVRRDTVIGSVKATVRDYGKYMPIICL